MIFLVLVICLAEANTYVVGGTANVHVEVDKEYHLVRYVANYKQLLVDIKVESGVDYVLISDKRIEKPNEGCPATSLYCTKLSSNRIIETLSVCVDDVYIHIFPSSSDRNIKLSIKTDYIKDTPCNDIDRNPTNFCPLLTPSECLDGCSSGCGLLTCQKKRSIGNQDIFQVCLKESISKEKLKEVCNGHSESNTLKWDVCSNTEESNSNWLVAIVVSLLVTLLLFGGVVVYYHKMTQKYGRPPFRVPGCCPKKLFPRDSEDEAENLRVIQ